MAYKLIPAEEVRRVVNDFTSDLRRAWDSRMNLLIEDPFPRKGDGFSIVSVKNQFGDHFLSLVVDDFPLTINFDVYPWPENQDNPLDFEGVINIFSLGQVD